MQGGMQQDKYSCETVQRCLTHIVSARWQRTCIRAARFPWRIETNVVESEDARFQLFSVRDCKWHHLVDGGGSKGQVAINLPQQPLHPVTPPNIAYPAAHISTAVKAVQNAQNVARQPHQKEVSHDWLGIGNSPFKGLVQKVWLFSPLSLVCGSWAKHQANEKGITELDGEIDSRSECLKVVVTGMSKPHSASRAKRVFCESKGLITPCGNTTDGVFASNAIPSGWVKR